MSFATARAFFSAGVCLTGLLSLVMPAHAQVTVTTTPFTGTLTESFESFPNYQSTPGVPIAPLANPTALFGGLATLSGASNLIYEPSAGAIFALGDNGFAQVADGTKGLGLNSLSYTATFTFTNPLTQLGGFFNATRTSTATDTVIFTFRDAANAVVDTKTLDVNPANSPSGLLNFYGFTSATAFSSLSITGNYVVLDSLRANAAPTPPSIPEPAPLALTAVPLLSVLVVLRRPRRA